MKTLKYPFEPKISLLNNRRKKKHCLEKYQNIALHLIVELNEDSTNEEIDNFNEVFQSYLSQNNMLLMGLSYTGDHFRDHKFQQIYIYGIKAVKNSDYTKASVMSDEQENLAIKWLENRSEIKNIVKRWYSDLNYCFLLWKNEWGPEDYNNNQGQKAINWYRSWFMKINNCLPCDVCKDKICQ